MSNYKQFYDIHTGELQNLLWNSVLDRADPSAFGTVRWHNRGPHNMVTKVVTQPYRLPRDETELVGRDMRPEARAFLSRVANELRQKIAKLQYPPREPNNFLDAYDVLRQRYRNEYRLEIQNGMLPDVDESDAYHWQVYTWYSSQLRRFEESLPTVKEYGTYPNPDSDVGWFTEHRWDVQNWDYKNRSAGLFPLTTHDNITELTGRCEPLVNFGIKKVTSDYHSGASDLRYACCNGPMGSDGCLIGYPMDKEKDDELLYDWFGGKYKDVQSITTNPSDYLQLAMKYRGVAFEDKSDADTMHEQIQTLYGKLSDTYWKNIDDNNGQLDPYKITEKDLIILSTIAEWMYQYNNLVTKQGPRTFPNASMAKTDSNKFREQMILYLKKTMGEFIKPSKEEERRRQEEKRMQEEEKRREKQEQRLLTEHKAAQRKQEEQKHLEKKKTNNLVCRDDTLNKLINSTNDTMENMVFWWNKVFECVSDINGDNNYNMLKFKSHTRQFVFYAREPKEKEITIPSSYFKDSKTLQQFRFFVSDACDKIKNTEDIVYVIYNNLRDRIVKRAQIVEAINNKQFSFDRFEQTLKEILGNHYNEMKDDVNQERVSAVVSAICEQALTTETGYNMYLEIKKDKDNTQIVLKLALSKEINVVVAAYNNFARTVGLNEIQILANYETNADAIKKTYKMTFPATFKSSTKLYKNLIGIMEEVADLDSKDKKKIEEINDRLKELQLAIDSYRKLLTINMDNLKSKETHAVLRKVFSDLEIEDLEKMFRYNANQVIKTLHDIGNHGKKQEYLEQLKKNDWTLKLAGRITLENIVDGWNGNKHIDEFEMREITFENIATIDKDDSFIPVLFTTAGETTKQALINYIKAIRNKSNDPYNFIAKYKKLLVLKFKYFNNLNDTKSNEFLETVSKIVPGIDIKLVKQSDKNLQTTQQILQDWCKTDLEKFDMDSLTKELNSTIDCKEFLKIDKDTASIKTLIDTWNKYVDCINIDEMSEYKIKIINLNEWRYGYIPKEYVTEDPKKNLKLKHLLLQLLSYKKVEDLKSIWQKIDSYNWIRFQIFSNVAKNIEMVDTLLVRDVLLFNGREYTNNQMKIILKYAKEIALVGESPDTEQKLINYALTVYSLQSFKFDTSTLEVIIKNWNDKIKNIKTAVALKIKIIENLDDFKADLHEIQIPKSYITNNNKAVNLCLIKLKAEITQKSEGQLTQLQWFEKLRDNLKKRKYYLLAADNEYANKEVILNLIGNFNDVKIDNFDGIIASQKNKFDPAKIRTAFETGNDNNLK